MKVTIVEGTPEEISQAFPYLNQTPPAISPVVVADTRRPAPATSEGEAGYVSTPVARAILSRRRLSNRQLAVLRAIYNAHPEKVLATALSELVGYTRAQFAGLMGAFGRRVAHTEGYEDGSSFFDAVWNTSAGCFEYRLPETVREAIRLEQLI